MLTDPALGAFLDARRAQGYRLWLSTKALVPLIGYLGSIGIEVASAPAALSLSEVLLSSQLKNGDSRADTKPLDVHVPEVEPRLFTHWRLITIMAE